MLKNFEETFKKYCNSENLEINQNQLLVIKSLQNYYKENFKPFIFNFFSKDNLKKGFYLFGGVGVGKTMILDFFFKQINKKKKDFILTNLCLIFIILYMKKKIKKNKM